MNRLLDYATGGLAAAACIAGYRDAWGWCVGLGVLALLCALAGWVREEGDYGDA